MTGQHHVLPDKMHEKYRAIPCNGISAKNVWPEWRKRKQGYATEWNLYSLKLVRTWNGIVPDWRSLQRCDNEMQQEFLDKILEQKKSLLGHLKNLNRVCIYDGSVTKLISWFRELYTGYVAVSSYSLENLHWQREYKIKC